ncbi:RNA-binding ATPase activator esf2 [Gaertneriomyces sp. JEL0708]|nr:RNA-binding ATPase activator esf2 [Gaertneriomyces sp. JEL0708]
MARHKKPKQPAAPVDTEEKIKARQALALDIAGDDGDEGKSEGESDDEHEGMYLKTVGRSGTDKRFVLSDEESGDENGEEEEGQSEGETDGDEPNMEGTKTSPSSDSDQAADSDEFDSEGEDEAQNAPSGDAEEDGAHDGIIFTTLPPAASSNAKPLTSTALKSSSLSKSGIIYLSRVPPFMRPQKLRQLLSSHGTINRIYLVPENPLTAARRKKYRKNSRQNFVEGWVEFTSKTDARLTAEHLNGKQIGGKKRSRYYDDIWNMKYLPRFKWNHLTEQIAYEKKVREQRVRTEMAMAKREAKGYQKNVHKAKMVEAIEERKRKRKEEDEGATPHETEKRPSMGDKAEVRRRFKQRKVADEGSGAKAENGGLKQSVLSKLFR